jgi:hypothetical protein
MRVFVVYARILPQMAIPQIMSEHPAKNASPRSGRNSLAQRVTLGRNRVLESEPRRGGSYEPSIVRTVTDDRADPK